MVVVIHGRRDLLEEHRSVVRPEVADRAAEERDEAPPVDWERVEVPVEVTDDRMHLQTCDLALDRGRGAPEDLFADVERDEPRQRPVAA